MSCVAFALAAAAMAACWSGCVTFFFSLVSASQWYNAPVAAMTVLGCWLCATVLEGVAPQTSPAWQPRIEALIRQLGDPSFAKRDAATRALMAEDEKIVPLLDRARKGADLELQRRIDRIRYWLVGYAEDLTALLSGPIFNETEAPPRLPLNVLLLYEHPSLLPDAVSFVAAHQPKSGDFLLKTINDPNHQLHRPATRLFCETWSSGSPQQLHTYLQTTFSPHAVHRRRYPQGVNAFIETRYWHPYGSIGWPKGLSWQVRMIHSLDGKPHGKPEVNKYPGGAAATGWINAGKLEQGQYVARFDVEYTFTHQGGKHQGKRSSPEFVFAVGPAILAKELIAPTDAALAKQVREALRMLDYHGQDGDEKVRRPWHPQIAWEEPKGKTRGLHMPVWSVKEPLPVDLCFEVTIRNVETGKLFPGDALILHRGKAGRGHFTPRDPRAFCDGRDGFVNVEIDLKPSPTQALSDPAVTRYFGWPITSPTLRAKSHLGTEGDEK
jgi:hypothetical protein